MGQVGIKDFKKDPGVWIEGMITGFIESSPENSMKDQANEKAWEEVLLGFSSGLIPYTVIIRNM